MTIDTTRLPPWLTRQRDSLTAMLAGKGVPQALLLHGQPGTGREMLAFWLAAQLLRVAPQPFMERVMRQSQESRDLVHPDFFLLETPPDKTAIGISQVRELLDFLNLRSHAGGPRVGMIRMADELTISSANGLLKTLEEPHPGNQLILVAQHLSRLPATVLSRCHRMAVHCPSEEDSIAWLSAEAGDAPWGELLEFCGGGPLLALQLSQDGFVPRAADYARDLAGVLSRRTSPTVVARKWAAGDPELAMLWLQRRLHRLIRDTVPGLAGVSLQSVNERRKIQALFGAVHELDEFRRRGLKGLTVELQLAAALEDWYGFAAATK